MADSAKIMEQIAADIHSGKIKKGDLIDPRLLEAIADDLMHGIGIGYGKSLKTPKLPGGDIKMLAAMQTNVYQFSGFKTAAQIAEVKALLHDSDGNVRDYKDFKKDVLLVDNTYNQTYLKTEYDTAVRGAEMGRKWQQIQNEAEHLPYLQYVTVGDNRVRHSHAILDGIIRRVDDPFWKDHYPPIKGAWNCRCGVKQLARAKESDVSHISPPPQSGKGNAQTGQVLDHDHYADLFDKEQKQAIIDASMDAMPKIKTFKERNQEVFDKPKHEQYDTIASHDSGGEVHIHELVNTQDLDHADVKSVALLMSKDDGHTVKILPKVHIDHPEARQHIMPGAKEGKNPDLFNESTNEYAEVKRPVTDGDYWSNISKIIAKGAKQADHVAVILDKPLTPQQMQSMATDRFKALKGLKKITFKQGSKLTVFNK